MTLKNIRPLFALICMMQVANPSFAQNDNQRDSFALRVYYSDLYLAFSQYELDHVPFQQKQVKVQPDDTLLTLARRNSVPGLDAIHLAAALYDANPQAFERGDASRLDAGSILNMPSVGDIFYAQERYETLKVAGNSLDFSSSENQMRNGFRKPFNKSLLAIGPAVRNELPGNQVVTLTSSRPESTGSGKSADPVQQVVRTAAAKPVSKKPKPTTKAKLLAKKEDNPPQVVATNAQLNADPDVAAGTDDRNALSTARAESSVSAEPDSNVADIGKPTAAASSDGAASVTNQALTAQPDTNQNKRAEDPNVKLAAALPAVKPAMAKGAAAKKSPVSRSAAYLGPPANADAHSLSVSSDPLSSTIEWRFDSSTSVGTVLTELAAYVGYELVSNDDMVLDAYTRKLPTIQREISGITAEDGFLMLAGRGLETVFDHVSRSVEHRPKRKKVSNAVVDNKANTAIHEEFVEVSGIASLLRQFPADISSAASRHAARCDSVSSTEVPNADRLYKVVIGKLQQKTSAPVANNLVAWYKSPTGRKVLKLEKQEIDDARLARFSMDQGRADRISQIYDNTVTGKGIASIAVELDYAGWSLSGCKQKAESTGDIGKMNQEMVHGQGIKKKLTRLESILREDTLQSLAYQFSSLTERELTEYADIVSAHAGVYSELGQSIVDAIEVETKIDALSLLQ